MYKIFIAEDEHLIRESLKRMLTGFSNFLPLGPIGDASDGELALAMIAEQKPDILLTDIRMPFMNGLELANEVKKLLPDIQIIFISGYDEFTYAKTAIQLQAADYLLKPIKPDELQESLEHIIQKLEADSLLKQAKETTSYSLEVQKNFYLNALFNNQLLLSEAIDEGRKLDREIAGNKFMVLLIANHANKFFSDYDVFHEKMAELFDNDKHMLFSSLSSRFIKLLIFDQNEEILQKKANQVALLSHKTLSHTTDDLVIAIGHPVQRISEIARSYETAVQLLSYLTVDPNLKILSYLDYEKKLTSYGQTFDLKESITLLRKSEIQPFIEELVKQIDQHADPLLIRHLIINELNHLVKIRQKQSNQVVSLASPEETPAILSETPLFKKYLEQMIHFLKEMVLENHMSQYKEVLEQSIEYIEIHYSEPELSLKEVADHVHLSSSHFSTIFSQALGQTFIDYLTEQRLSMAKRLLRETNLKLSAIAAEVGYNDPNYFSSIFKRKETISPKEYRKMKQKGGYSLQENNYLVNK
ncbi:response regulator [Candidatus Enterococcus mangumiae]|uniref:Two-component system, response regulator YesN n=1 Tax=Candidatus Enterococcus mangumiae TaxID=2230878 RepID=A0ABZ2T0P4_9ENTE|nr:response regulator [Enterococcus sp. DIV1094]MBO0491226.1 response regulator [Enterococcus sp. DIV1094]